MLRRSCAVLGGASLVLATLVIPAVALGGGLPAGRPPGHAGIVPPRHPSRNLSPHPDFLSARACAGGGDRKACNSRVLAAITRARKLLEKMPGMSFSLPAYERLTPDEQLFVTVDLERVARGLPPATVLSKSLDTVAQRGANADSDPPLAAVPRRLPGGGQIADEGGNWAGGWQNALGADYGWMYDDGPGTGGGDWGHRDNILGTFNSARICGGGKNELAMGAGHVTRGERYGDSETELLAGVCGPAPTDVVLSWARARSLLGVTFKR